ncbi:unnamed protein product, partial [marine sediment metagenome]
QQLLRLEQEFKQRGNFFLVIDAGCKLIMSIGTYSESSYSGNLTLTKKQAKKLAGYLFFWAGEMLVGKRKIKIPAETSYIFDINDKV